MNTITTRSTITPNTTNNAILSYVIGSFVVSCVTTSSITTFGS